MDKSIDAFSMMTKTYASEDTLVWTGYRNKGYCESVQSSKTVEVLYQKVHEIIVTSCHPELDSPYHVHLYLVMGRPDHDLGSFVISRAAIIC